MVDNKRPFKYVLILVSLDTNVCDVCIFGCLREGVHELRCLFQLIFHFFFFLESRGKKIRFVVARRRRRRKNPNLHCTYIPSSSVCTGAFWSSFRFSYASINNLSILLSAKEKEIFSWDFSKLVRIQWHTIAFEANNVWQQTYPYQSLRVCMAWRDTTHYADALLNVYFINHFESYKYGHTVNLDHFCWQTLALAHTMLHNQIENWYNKI